MARLDMAKRLAGGPFTRELKTTFSTGLAEPSRISLPALDARKYRSDRGPTNPSESNSHLARLINDLGHFPA